MTYHHDFSKCYNFVIFGDFFIIPFLGVPKLAKFLENQKKSKKKIFLMSGFIPLCTWGIQVQLTPDCTRQERGSFQKRRDEIHPNSGRWLVQVHRPDPNTCQGRRYSGLSPTRWIHQQIWVPRGTVLWPGEGICQQSMCSAEWDGEISPWLF